MAIDPSLFKSAADSVGPHLIEVRRDLHRHPEISGEEVRTTARLRDLAVEAGLTILDLPLKTGLVAEVRGAKTGPTVAIRTDIDALPVQEETGVGFASTIPGKMHACGHDFHTSIVLGAAMLLQAQRAHLAGTVRFLFQPAEEIATGARDLIAAGAMAGVSAVFGLHNKPDLPAGVVGLKSGPLMAASDTITIVVEGKGGHAAIPDSTIDPIVTASAIVGALQTVVSRTVSPLDAAVVSIASFQAGASHNVIPPSATLLGTVRTFRPEVRNTVITAIERVITDVASGFGCTAQLRVSQGTPAVVNDEVITAVMGRAASLLGQPTVEAMATMGAEDFAEYQQLAPGCYIWMGTGCAENWHHPKFMVDEAVIPQAAALFAQVAVEALSALKR